MLGAGGAWGKLLGLSNSGSLSGLNSTLVYDNSAGYSTFSFVITGTWSGTITPQVSVDGINWLNWDCADRTTFYTSLTANGTFTSDISTHRYLRLNMTSYSSGTASVAFFVSSGVVPNKRIILNTQTLSSNGNSQRAQVATIETEHDKIHLGLMFRWQAISTLNVNQFSRYSMTTGAQLEHTVFALFVESQIAFRLYEEAVTTDGATITERNRQRSSANTSLCTIAQVNTVTSSGTLLEELTFGSGAGTASAVQIPRAQEWDLKANTKYMFEIQSLGNNNDITLQVDHYRNQA